MSIRRMMLFTLGGFFKSIISLFKTRVLSDGGTFEAETNLENQLNALGSTLFDSASLVITPNGVKTNKLYTIKPNDGTGDLDGVRATSATRVNEQGLIEIPRTNLLLQSDMFANPFWVKDFSSISPNDQISPDGTLTADTFTANGTTNIHQMYQNGNVTSGITYTNSIFAKKGTNDFIQLAGGNAAFGLNSFANFDLNNGTVGTVGSTTTASIQNIGNGWYRCIVTFTAISTTSIAPILLFIVNSSSAVKAQSNNLSTSVYLWGAQVEQGVTATEYIPTTSVIRTRFAGITQDGGSASNIPRIDYTTGSPSILVEPQRTNLFLWSEKFDKASWGKFSLSVTPNTTLSPSGFVNADMITSTNINTIFLLQLITITSGTIYSISFYVKQDTQRFVYIRFTSNATSQNYVSAVFDLQDGTVGQTSVGTTSGTLISSDVKNAGNGFYRVSITASINVTDGNIGIGFAPSKTGNTFSASGTITSNVASGGSIFVWGAQLEAGSNATSYIPTTTSSVTRNADVISKSEISNLIGQTEGTLFLDASSFNLLGTGFGERISFTDGTFNNRMAIELQGNGVVSLIGSNSTAGLTGGINTPTSVISANNRFKIAIAYAGSNSILYVNGVAFSTIVGTIPTFTGQLNKFEFNQGNGSRPFYGKINSVLSFKTRLSNLELQQLTTL